MRTAATMRAGASIRAFALSVGLAAMLGAAGPGVSAELKTRSPHSPPSDNPSSVSDATILRTTWRGTRSK